MLAGAKDPPSRHAPNLPAELDAVVMTALALDPTDRFASAQEMAEMLRRVVPPAFATDVGRWVEEVAGEGLAQRGAALADIESSSGMATVPPPVSAAKLATRPERAVVAGAAPVLPRDVGEDDAPTVASQPSSLSVETPRPSVASAWRSRRTRLAGVVGAAVLLAAAIAVLAWRGSGASSTAAAGASATVAASAPSTPAPQAPPSAPEPDSSASASSGVSSAPVAATAAAPATTARPASTVAKPRHPPKPAGSSFRFAQPD